MENLAYLYILAEEAALEVDNTPYKPQNEQQLRTHHSPNTGNQSVDGVKAALAGDLDQQSYPTFYL